MNQDLKIAIPVDDGQVSSHFGHAPVFLIYHIHEGKVSKIYSETPPPHEPGVIPRWVSGLGVNKLITGGIGKKAVDIFNQLGVDVLSGAATKPADELIADYLAGTLELSGESCNHDHHH